MTAVPQAAPTVVKELAEKRTDTSDTYLLTDGSYRTQFFAGPINYTTTDGSKRPIDTTLVPDLSDPGTVRTAATAVTTRFSDGLTRAPVVVSSPSWTASIDFLGADQGDPLVLGDNAIYSDVATATDLVYHALSSGVKETLLLDDASAPNTFRFRVDLDGLEVRAGLGGTAGAYLPDSSVKVLSLGALTVWDSSSVGGDPDVCQSASATVEAAPGGAVITYRIDPVWLKDPARVFPIHVDPTITSIVGHDTFVSSASPTTPYGSLDYLRCGRRAGSNDTGYNRAYLYFDVSSLASATVSAATLSMNCSSHYDGGVLNKTVYLRTTTRDWDDSTTWNSRPSMGSPDLFSGVVSGTGWASFTVGAPTVKGWIDYPATNYGLQIGSNEAGNADQLLNDFYALESGPSLAPHLDVTYTQNTPAGVSAATPNVSELGWFRQSDSNGDHIPDTLDDVAAKGRGSVTVTWAPVPAASGYLIWGFDGAAWRQIGLSVGHDSTRWSSAGAGIYPSDTRISQLAGGKNGFALASTPSTGSLDTSLVAKGPNGSAMNGAGIVVSDGTYLYVRPWCGSGPSPWVKVNAGVKDPSTSAGSFVATVGPDRPASLSAFYLDGYLYSGVTDAASSTVLDGVWKDAAPGADSSKTLSFNRPLLSRYGQDITDVNDLEMLVASDGKDNIYSAAMSTGANRGYDGWKVRVFDTNGRFDRDVTITGPSYYTDGFVTDGKSAFFIEWNRSNNARVTRASLSDGKVTGRWTIDQGTSGAVGGAYDPSNNCIWLGQLDGGSHVMRYYGPGLDLRDSPVALYNKVAPSWSLRNTANYYFKITPYNASSQTATSSCATITVTLHNQTVSGLDDVRHTTFDLRDALDNNITALVETGALTIDVTDLDIKSPGPDANLTRHYSSVDTATGSFGPGWHVSFSQCVTQTAPAVFAYVDTDGEGHSFVATGGIYVSPAGFDSTLTSDTTAWLLIDKDRTVSRFDLSSGRLLSETDANSNHTDYTWTSDGSGLAITAANGQSIQVTLDSGKLAHAVYATTDGTRTVDYDALAGTVTRNKNVAGQERTTTYGRPDAGQPISDITITAPSEPTLGTWGFGYDASSHLATVTYPGYSETGRPDLSAHIDYRGSEASVTTHGEVNGATTDIHQTFHWNPTGTESDHTNAYATGETPAYWQYAYAPGNESIVETSPAGHLIHRTVDASGNTTFEWDENGHMTSYVYDQWSNCVREVDPRGDTTWRSYDTSSNLVAESRQLNDKDAAHTIYEYDHENHSLLSTETKSISTTDPNQVQVTRYADWAPSGDPQTVTQVGVALSATATPVSLTTTTTCDAFGNVTKQYDALGTTTSVNAYSPTTLENLITATDATNTVTHHAYDPYGREVDSSRTAGTDFCDWAKKSYDAFGNVATESILPSVSPDVVDRTVTHTYDARGLETKSDDSKVSGFARSVYDVRGEVTTSWAEGTDTNETSASTRATFDAYGQELTRIEPGSVASSTVTTYYPDGSVKRVDNANGTWEIDSYDEAGNNVRTQASSDDGTQTATSVYDVGGRLVSETDAGGNTTTHSYDLLDRETGAKGDGSSPSVTTYNTLGWQLSQTDADGIAKTDVYDSDGRVKAESLGGQTTQTEYDPLGRAVETTSADLSHVSTGYDAFGRVNEASEVTSRGVAVKLIYTAFDTLSRATDTTDTLRGNLHSRIEFGSDQSAPTTVTVTRDGAPTLTTVSDAKGLVTSRQATIGPLSAKRSFVERDNVGRETRYNILNTQGTATYDASGHLIGQGGFGFKSGSDAVYVYSTSSGKKTSETFPFAFASASEKDVYAYDASSRLATWTASGIWNVSCSPTATYAYNAQAALATVSLSTTVGPWAKGTTKLTYDETTGRLLTRASSAATHTYVYDPATGARTSEGPFTGATTTTYAWYGGRLTGYTNSSTGTTATYTYDASGQRASSSVTATATRATTSTAYVYGGLSLLSLTATASANATSTWTIDYVYDGAGHPYAGFYREGTSTVVFGIVTTDRGDVAELTDTNGTPFATYRYDPWGSPISSDTTSASLVSTLAATIATRQPLRYAGYVYDSESGLYYCSQRYYDPAVAAFISKDPARAAGEMSAYGYCGANPVARADPRGLEFKEIAPGAPLYDQQVDDCVVAAMENVRFLLGIGPEVDRDSEFLYWYAGTWTLWENPKANLLDLTPRADSKWWGTSYFKTAVKAHYGFTIGKYTHGRLSWDALRKEIRANRPVVAAGGSSLTPGGQKKADLKKLYPDDPDVRYFNPKAGHAWVFSGFKSKRGKDKQVRICTWGSRQWISWKKMISKQGAQFKWNEDYRWHWQYTLSGLRR